MAQPRQTEHDTIAFGLQTYSLSAQLFRLESDSNLYSLEYELVCIIYMIISKLRKTILYAFNLDTRTIKYKIKFGRKTIDCLFGDNSSK